MIESLERRQLLSATASIVGCGILVVQLDDSGQSIHVVEDASGNTVQVSDFSPAAPTSTLGTFGNVKAVVILGGSGNDTITAAGQNVPFFIAGEGGNDLISLEETAPTQFDLSGSLILGGAGDDTIITKGVSNSAVFGGDGNDTIIAGGQVLYDNSSPTPVALGAYGGDHMLIDGGAGNDTIFSGNGVDVVGARPDIIPLTNSTLLGGSGNDTITDYSTIGGNVVGGGSGTDLITLYGKDIVICSAGNDMIVHA